MKDMEKRIDDYEQLISGNEIFMMRMKNIGVLSAKMPSIVYDRSNTSWSWRKLWYKEVEPYSVYPDLDFKACVRNECDSFADTWLEWWDERKSAYPEAGGWYYAWGKTNKPGNVWDSSDDWRSNCSFHVFSENITPPPGEVYSRIEAPKEN